MWGPVVLGVIVTLIVQLAPAANMLGPSWQVLVWGKSPLMVMLLMVSGASPLFRTMTVLAALVVPTRWSEKLSQLVLRPTTGATPCPVSATVCGLFGALSLMLSTALLPPRELGLNATLIWQLAPAASVLGQAEDRVNWPGLAPPRAILVMDSGAPALLVSVTVCGLLAVPTSWEPKARLDGLTAEVGPEPGTGVNLATTAWSRSIVKVYGFADPVAAPSTVQELNT